MMIDFAPIIADSLLMRKSIRERFEEKYEPEPNTGCWLWTAGCNEHGYGQIRYTGKMPKAHRVSYELHIGPIPDGMCVCHRCDTPACVNPDHLFLGTHLENMSDRDDKGRNKPASGDRHYARTKPERLARGDRHGSRTKPESRPRGGRCRNAKLTEENARYARDMRGVKSQRALAKELGVSNTVIRSIQLGRRWAHIR